MHDFVIGCCDEPVSSGVHYEYPPACDPDGCSCVGCVNDALDRIAERLSASDCPHCETCGSCDTCEAERAYY
jgi:hypothetical protein